MLWANCSRAAKAAGSFCSIKIWSAASKRKRALLVSCKARKRKLAMRNRCSASAKRQSWRLAPKMVSRRCDNSCCSACTLAKSSRPCCNWLAEGICANVLLSCCSRSVKSVVCARMLDNCCCCCAVSSPAACICSTLQTPAPKPPKPKSRASTASPLPDEPEFGLAAFSFTLALGVSGGGVLLDCLDLDCAVFDVLSDLAVSAGVSVLTSGFSEGWVITKSLC